MTRQIRLPGLVLVIAMAGCSGGRVAPVSGTVTLSDGQPAAGVTVCFSDRANRVSASGTCDERGRYRLTTFQPGDGAPPGDYDVTVHPPTPEDSSQAQKNTLFHVRYENPDTSGLQYTVAKGRNQIDIVLDDP
jgi:hypothetical protein